jgi:hypothetical protein
LISLGVKKSICFSSIVVISVISLATNGWKELILWRKNVSSAFRKPLKQKPKAELAKVLDGSAEVKFW